MPYKLSNGKYRAHKQIQGRRKTKIFNTKREAKAWETKQTEEKWQAETTPIISCHDWATKYLDMATNYYTPQTYQEKKTVLRDFLASIDPHRAAEDITPQDAARYLGEQARTRSGHAANKDRKNLMAAWSWGVRYLGLPEKSPFKAVDRYPEVKTPRYIPPPEHMESILANETGEVRVFLLTMLHTAARRGELLRLRWDDLDFDRRTVRLSTRKRQGGSLEYDHIPMTAELREALREHKREARSVHVFCDEAGKPYSARRHLMWRVCKRNEVPYFGFHAVRHLSASIMDKAGVPTATIQAILRHKSRTTTDRYLHQLRGVRADLDGVFSKEGKVLEIRKAPTGTNGEG
jgi:integrase